MLTIYIVIHTVAGGLFGDSVVIYPYVKNIKRRTDQRDSESFEDDDDEGSVILLSRA